MVVRGSVHAAGEGSRVTVAGWFHVEGHEVTSKFDARRSMHVGHFGVHFGVPQLVTTSPEHGAMISRPLLLFPLQKRFKLPPKRSLTTALIVSESILGVIKMDHLTTETCFTF